MEKKEFLKVIGLFIILFMYMPKFTAKNIINSDITNRSYLFFCDSIVKNDSSLVSMEIFFDGIANKQISDIFYISDCIGEISLIKDSIPNKKELNKLEKKHRKTKVNPLVLDIKSSIFLLEETHDSLRLIICSPVIYKDSIYQEYKLVSKYNEVKRVIIKIDKDSFKPLNYCITSFIYG